MGATMKGRHRSTTTEKVEWLLKNQPLWDGISLTSCPSESKLITLRETMIDAGLYSIYAYARDIDISIRKHCDRARAVRRKRSATNYHAY